ncbi:hypothetical protein HPELS_06170 [Helicobacter pylori ELS37]|uniref:Uncharacterized protein n=1 Tax=Helicobacter pylori ELS37 TaxID=1055527 RepID=A0ABC7ZH07_HELPX|nr:hypothetical protein HPELS_06170 [Helicobacter pylori ELS37]
MQNPLNPQKPIKPLSSQNTSQTLNNPALKEDQKRKSL